MDLDLLTEVNILLLLNGWDPSILKKVNHGASLRNNALKTFTSREDFLLHSVWENLCEHLKFWGLYITIR